MKRITRSILSFLLCATGSVLFAQQPPTPKPVGPDVAKRLHDALDTRNLDQIDVQQAQTTVLQRNPLAKRANDVLIRIVNSDDDVKKANTQLDTDQKALEVTVTAARKAANLDDSWDFDFNLNQWVQIPKSGKAAPAAPPAKPEAPKK